MPLKLRPGVGVLFLEGLHEVLFDSGMGPGGSRQTTPGNFF
ncbi:MAG: hypothetical protein ACE5JD_16910 [Candidatus Methylomirabilia bacterium]